MISRRRIQRRIHQFSPGPHTADHRGPPITGAMGYICDTAAGYEGGYIERDVLIHPYGSRELAQGGRAESNKRPRHVTAGWGSQVDKPSLARNEQILLANDTNGKEIHCVVCFSPAFILQSRWLKCEGSRRPHGISSVIRPRSPLPVTAIPHFSCLSCWAPSAQPQLCLCNTGVRSPNRDCHKKPQAQNSGSDSGSEQPLHCMANKRVEARIITRGSHSG